LWKTEVAGRKTERLLAWDSIEDYSVSADGKQVVFATGDNQGHSALWTAPTDRRASPRRLTAEGVSEDTPNVLPGGDVVFRVIERGGNWLYRMKADGSDRRRLRPERVLDVVSVSPDGRWILASAPNADSENPASLKAFPSEGDQAPVTVCRSYCGMIWDTAGKYAIFSQRGLADNGVPLPVLASTGLPKLPPDGIGKAEDLAAAKALAPLTQYAEAAISPAVFAYSRREARRNLFRIPLP